MCPPPPHKHPVLEMPTSQAPQSPSGPIPHPLHPKAHRRPLWPPPSPSPTYLPQPGSDLCVPVCQCVFSVLVADKEPPRKQSMCVCSHWTRWLREPASASWLSGAGLLTRLLAACHPHPTQPPPPVPLSLSQPCHHRQQPPQSPPPPTFSSFRHLGGEVHIPSPRGRRLKMPGVGVGGHEGAVGQRGTEASENAVHSRRWREEASCWLTWPPSRNLWGLAKPAGPRPPKKAGRARRPASPRPGWDRPLQSSQRA